MFLFSILFLAPAVYANGVSNNQPNDNEFLDMSLDELANVELYLPSVMTAHIHKKGEWMVGVRQMYMHMSGLRDGTSNVARTTVLSPSGYNFMAAPKSMDMSMTMFHLMYGATDRLTLMAMAPYIYNHMRIVLRNGTQFSTESQGLGDISLNANYELYSEDDNYLYTGLGASLPTGSINKTDFNPMMGKHVILPYPMQLGSGTVDLIPALTYIHSQPDKNNNIGLTLQATVPLGRNYRGYSLGDEQTALLWFTHGWSEEVSTELGLKGYHRGNIHGADSALNPNAAPTANPNIQEKTVASLHVSTELYAQKGKLKGNRLTLGVGRPVYEDFHGPQLRTKWIFDLTWKYTFLA